MSEVLKDFPRSKLPAPHLIAREAAAHLGWGLLYPLGIKHSLKRTPRKREQRTVVFVHGYLANRASFLPLAAYLRLVGVGHMLSFNYSSSLGVENAAIALQKYIRNHVRGGRVDLVCHSMGGVVARYYIHLLGGKRRVDRCITIATAHRGTYSSYWIASKVGRELAPDSELLARLDLHQSRANKVKYTSIVGGSDNIVLPRKFAVGSEDIVHIPDVGHVGLLFSPTVFQTVARRLL